VVPQLAPELVHRIIQHCGLEDCSPILALTTPEQLAGILDLDLWRASRPGLDEEFDAGRFVHWLDVLMESGAAVAARKVAEMDVDLVIAGLSQHARVFDVAAIAPYTTTDGELIDPGRDAKGDHTYDIGGYRLVAKSDASWDAMMEILTVLESAHPDRFGRVMRGCRELSNAGHEIDGLNDLAMPGDQAMFDVADGREQRRDSQGFVTPAEARAFLKTSRGLRPDAKKAPAVTIIDPVRDAGAIAQRMSLFDGPQASVELTWLANAIIAGCSIQARPFTPEEASQAVAAACSLGLENWARYRPSSSPSEANPLDVFQVGWTVLHDDVAMYAAQQLVAVLKDLRCEDREIQKGINALRIQLTKRLRLGTPWLAEDAMDVLATLDMPAWAGLLGLIAECPVIHAGLRASLDPRARAVNADEFEFIAENGQIASVREFMRGLPRALSR
jgi:hypothetical protein